MGRRNRKEVPSDCPTIPQLVHDRDNPLPPCENPFLIFDLRLGVVFNSVVKAKPEKR